MSRAAMFQYMKMPEQRRDSGRGAVLLHEQMERGSVDRPLLLRQEDRARGGFRAPSARRGGPGLPRALGGARRSWSPSAGGILCPAAMAGWFPLSTLRSWPVVASAWSVA